MNGKDFDGLIDQMGTLVVNQSERAAKIGQNEFINELNYDYNHVSLNAFASTHLVAESIGTKRYLLLCERLMGPMKSKPHFMNGSTKSMVIDFAIRACKRFPIR
jgi:hypothetical protein